jgi:NAD(P)-dependent dehydrogenase (short-subunit alcohol dehydrogenase family)
VIKENPQHLEHSQAPFNRAPRALKRDQYPEDLLGALVFLSSADSDFVTGQTIAVDGGATNN